MYLHFLNGLRLGLRSRSFLGLALVGVLALGGALLAAEFSGRQPATVALDVGISAVRIIGVLLALFWVQELFTRDTEQRVLHTVLSYPTRRADYVLGRFGSVAVLLALALAGSGVLLALVGWLAGLGYSQPTPVSAGLSLVPLGLYLWLDLLTITAFAWLLTTLSTTPFLPFALGAAFAWAARSLAPVLGYLVAGQGVMEDLRGELYPVLNGLLWLLPDLSRLDLRPAVLYGQWPDPGFLGLAALNTLGYIALLLGLAVWGFNRRELA
ncbi:MAG: hypothetical protein ACLFRB_00955 [Thiohalorhabdus sp.]|uniref:hypothetical protein n=1 Tax=Thiohalorhabdus sp. TaxID=3094134 RepID=UPI003980ABB7